MDLAKLLVEKGADAGLPNKAGNTAYGEVPRWNTEMRKVLERACHVVEVPVPRQVIPRVIGTRGANIERLQRTYAVTVNVKRDEEKEKEKEEDKTEEEEESGDDDDTVVVRVIGREENTAKAVADILAVVKEYEDKRQERAQDDTVVVLAVSHEHFGVVVGAGGRNIRRLCDKYHVEIDLVRGDAAARTSDGVRVKGTSENVVEASREIMQATVKWDHSKGRPQHSARGDKRTAQPAQKPKPKPKPASKQGTKPAAAAAPKEGAPQKKEQQKHEQRHEERGPRRERERAEGQRTGGRREGAERRYMRAHTTPGVQATESKPAPAPQKKPTFEDFMAPLGS